MPSAWVYSHTKNVAVQDLNYIYVASPSVDEPAMESIFFSQRIHVSGCFFAKLVAPTVFFQLLKQSYIQHICISNDTTKYLQYDALHLDYGAINIGVVSDFFFDPGIISIWVTCCAFISHLQGGVSETIQGFPSDMLNRCIGILPTFWDNSPDVFFNPQLVYTSAKDKKEFSVTLVKYHAALAVSHNYILVAVMGNLCFDPGIGCSMPCRSQAHFTVFSCYYYPCSVVIRALPHIASKTIVTYSDASKRQLDSIDKANYGGLGLGLGRWYFLYGSSLIPYMLLRDEASMMLWEVVHRDTSAEMFLPLDRDFYTLPIAVLTVSVYAMASHSLVASFSRTKLLEHSYAVYIHTSTAYSGPFIALAWVHLVTQLPTHNISEFFGLFFYDKFASSPWSLSSRRVRQFFEEVQGSENISSVAMPLLVNTVQGILLATLWTSAILAVPNILSNIAVISVTVI